MNLDSLRKYDLVLGTALLFFLKPVVILLGRILGRDHDLAVRGPIAVIKLHGGGSLVIAYPSLLAIRRKYPDVPLIMLCTRETRVYSETLGIFDKYVEIKTTSLPTLITSSICALWQLRHVDTTIDFEVHSRLTTIFAALTLARNRIGFYTDNAYWRIGVATYLVSLNLSAGIYIFYRHIAKLLNAQPPKSAECREHFCAALRAVNEQPRAGAVSLRPKIGLVCLCSGFGRERMLTPEQWVQIFASRFDHGNFEVAIFGGRGESEQAEPFVAALSSAFPAARVENACLPRTLSASLTHLTEMDEVWSIDSGLLHLARLAGIPTRSFWGPTDPATRLDMEYGMDLDVQYHRIPCSPCIHVNEVSPCNGNQLCMKLITAPPPAGPVEPMWLVKSAKT